MNPFGIALTTVTPAQPQHGLANYNSIISALTVVVSGGRGGSELAEPYQPRPRSRFRASGVPRPFWWDNIGLSLASAAISTLATTMVCKMLETCVIKVIF
jgi:hypothetical protein